MGECSEGVSGKAGIPQRSYGASVAVWGASHNAWLSHCHGDASFNDTNAVRDEGRWGGGAEVEPERAIFKPRKSGTQTGSYITQNRPQLYSSFDESCLERVCWLQGDAV